MAGLIARPFVFCRMVYPSGGDFATASAATLPPAPGRFSTITGWPRDSLSLAPSMRASMSTAPPATKGTMTRIGLLG
jgi:hypothetical protein